MKTNILKTSLLALIIALGSCSKDDSNNEVVIPAPVISDADYEADIKSDLAIDNIIDNINDDLSNLYQSSAAGKGISTEEILANACDITPTTGLKKINNINYFTLTYNFAEGCTQPSGNVLKGIMVIAFNEGNPTFIMFENFYHNENMVSGNISSMKALNLSKQPYIKNTQDITVTFKNGKVYKRKGVITRTFTKGFDTKEQISDDEFATTGEWMTTLPDGTINKAKITKDLIIRMGCTFKKHVNGTISFDRNGNYGTLDFGDGNCFTKWTLTRFGKQGTTVTPPTENQQVQ